MHCSRNWKMILMLNIGSCSISTWVKGFMLVSCQYTLADRCDGLLCWVGLCICVWQWRSWSMGHTRTPGRPVYSISPVKSMRTLFIVYCCVLRLHPGWRIQLKIDSGHPSYWHYWITACTIQVHGSAMLAWGDVFYAELPAVLIAVTRVAVCWVELWGFHWTCRVSDTVLLYHWWQVPGCAFVFTPAVVFALVYHVAQLICMITLLSLYLALLSLSQVTQRWCKRSVRSCVCWRWL